MGFIGVLEADVEASRLVCMGALLRIYTLRFLVPLGTDLYSSLGTRLQT